MSTELRFEKRLRDGRELEITPVETDDAARIVAYVEKVSGESDNLTFGPGEFGMSVEDEVKFIAGLDGGRFSFMLKGVVDGEVVSSCSLMRSKRPRISHVGDFGISVAKSHWGLGIGRQMCLAMLERARQLGVKKVDLRVREDNERAIRLYESVGFRHEGVLTRAFQIQGKYFDNKLMGYWL